MRILSVAALLFIALPAFGADRLPTVGSVDRLVYDALDLNRLVQQSWFKQETKSLTQLHASNAERLLNCVRISNLLSCGGVLQQTQTSWLSVERKLNDTMFDYTQLYRQYVEARRSLYQLQGAPQMASMAYVSTGTLDGLPFYFVDSTQDAITESCLEFTINSGLGSVQTIMVGGKVVQTGQYSVSTNQACLIVGQSATR